MWLIYILTHLREYFYDIISYSLHVFLVFVMGLKKLSKEDLKYVNISMVVIYDISFDMKKKSVSPVINLELLIPKMLQSYFIISWSYIYVIDWLIGMSTRRGLFYD